MSLWTTINLVLAILLTLGVSAVAILVPWHLDRPRSAAVTPPRAVPASPARRAEESKGRQERTAA